MEIVWIVLFAIIVFFVLGLVLGSFYTVQQQSRAIIERFGKYVRTATPGLNFKIPYIEARGAARLAARAAAASSRSRPRRSTTSS